jgi:uncharacterized membrane protein YccF (DUF307 family)
MKVLKEILRTIYDIFCYVAWFALGGIWLFCYCLVTGLSCCSSLILIPIGLQFFKAARFALWPFRVEIETTPGGVNGVFNGLWGLVFGLWIALLFYCIGALLYCTIIFMPIGGQYFKFAKLVLSPLGAKIVTAESVRRKYPLDPYSNGSSK